jgi:uncharacterized protein (DUF952 family)
MTAIYHIAAARDVELASGAGHYAPPEYDGDGFIHCSHVHQVVAVANRRYRGQHRLVLLEIDRARLACPVVVENLEGGAELFPHMYGRLPMSAVVAVHQFPCEADGRFRLPPALAIDAQ